MRPLGWLRGLFLTVLLAGQGAIGIDLNVNDPESLKSAAALSASIMMDYYNARESRDIPGKLDGTWWEGGAIFMTLIQYWYFTGDTTYNAAVSEGMYWQKGKDNDYFPSNYSNYLGNDDQMFWGLAAMTAAELNYTENAGEPSWLALAQGVFNTQVPRWDPDNCHGGMRWQIWPYQAGYDIKNAVSNGGLFQLAARLAVYTGNQTYADWAEKIWDWSMSTPLIKNQTWTVADTVSTENQCADSGDIQWTYNYGIYLFGAAYMYKFTNQTVPKWKIGMEGLMNATWREFYPQQYGGNIVTDFSCEIPKNCDGNQVLFKGFLSAWLAFLTTLQPETKDIIMPKLQGSAVGAAKQCSGGNDGKHCGSRWYQDTWDGTSGIGQQMAALAVFASNLVTEKTQAPLTSNTGGTSQSDPSAGTGTDQSSPAQLSKISTGDRAGAGILTGVFLTGWIGALTWMIRGG
ncbi:hypothetical protein MPDQ_005889 [Monascus purpureus]|uniref:Mannan endo-1,6-alpha-mannosidase n=1 Tax=Monascus purpureus TaxID=5098 RepID=A0A507QXQ8_MONPU|nr:hypothetical protein MPDQ_005889 [Monascus purpureus]BDD55427.1 hypothetical protein MAP00_000949 [Monascus purpureus]